MKAPNEPKILRQRLQNRIVHWGIALSTFTLIFTGILQLPVAKRYMLNELPLMGWSADYHISLIVHYLAAIALVGFVAFHIVFHLMRGERDILPRKGDMRKSALVIKAMLTKSPEPPSAKYLPEQRLAYIAIGATLLLLIITGLIKTAKNLAGVEFPNGVYFWSAQLHNLGLFLIIFGIIGHLAAFIFKENRHLLSAMFSGKVSARYTLHRHSLWIEGCEDSTNALNRAKITDDKSHNKEQQ